MWKKKLVARLVLNNYVGLKFYCKLAGQEEKIEKKNIRRWSTCAEEYSV